MKTKLISVICAGIIASAAVLPLAGCGSAEFPVEVANCKIDKAPEKIVALDAPTADVISYLGYDVRLVGRSDEVDQSFLGVVPSVGDCDVPNVEELIKTEADIIFAGENLDKYVKARLEEKGLKVIKMVPAESAKDLETNYTSIAKLLGGKTEGAAQGAQAYKKLIEAMEELKAKSIAANKSDTLETACYIYSDGDELRLASSGSYFDMLLGYTGLVNVAVNIDSKLDSNTLKVANPAYIFYSDEDALKAIQSDAVLSKLAAVRGRKMLEVSSAEVDRQGYTALETLEKMIGFIHPELAKASATDATPAATQPATQSATQSAVQATTQAATQATTQTTTESATQTAQAKSVAADYKITIDDKLELKVEDENDNVKAMQQRLYDLGYVDDKENITGYYGELTKKSVTDFQKANRLSETGTADNATLVKIFSSDAVKPASQDATASTQPATSAQ